LRNQNLRLKEKRPFPKKHYINPLPPSSAVRYRKKIEDLFSSVLSTFKKYHLPGNLKFKYLGNFPSIKLRISMIIILSISRKLVFTQNTLGCYGYGLIQKFHETNILNYVAAGAISASQHSTHVSKTATRVCETMFRAQKPGFRREAILLISLGKQNNNNNKKTSLFLRSTEHIAAPGGFFPGGGKKGDSRASRRRKTPCKSVTSTEGTISGMKARTNAMAGKTNFSISSEKAAFRISGFSAS